MAAEQEEQHDVIVVGAGVAGGALAICLARDGRRVLLIERDLFTDNGSDMSDDSDILCEPDRIVGELLQPGGYLKLIELGLKESLDFIDAQSIFGYGIFLDDKRERINYTCEEKPTDGVSGRSFHNGKFLRRLRELARAERNVTLIQGDVVSLDKSSIAGTEKVVGVSYRAKKKKATSNNCENEKNILLHAKATLTIACDGCASRLRRKVSPSARPEVYSYFVGMLLDNVDLPYPMHGHVILANPAPMLFYPVSSTQVRCLIDIPKSKLGESLTGYLLNHLVPQLPEELIAPFTRAIECGRMKTMPNRVMPSAPEVVGGAILLGDSFNMRHPLTGGGMTVALNDVCILRKLLRDTPDLAAENALCYSLHNFHRDRKPLSTTINILANALYSVFCATDDPALQEMRVACFDYLAAGGRCTHDPMGLIGGIKPYPTLLVAHFFSVALYGCSRALKPFPTFSRVAKAWDIFKASFNIVKPLIDAEELKPLSWLPFNAL